MAAPGYWETLVEQQGDGTAVTAAAATSCVTPACVIPLAGGYVGKIGKQLLIKASGKISCVVTTPGTARFDWRLGGTVVFDGLAVPLNIVAQVNVPWSLEILLTARIVGTVAQFIGWGRFSSRAIVGTPAAGTGPIGCEELPYNVAAGTLGTAFNATVSNTMDMQFTQTVATGSLTVLQYAVYGTN